ncbi:MAG: proton-conducting membrane transporter [Clostridia bacterium]|nr:proton-conducting membrane transporter [Clostridia bacterium]
MLFLSILMPVLGAAVLWLWKPQCARARHIFTIAVTLLTSILTAWCIFTPGSQQFTLLQLTPRLTISFKLDGLGRIFSGMVALLWPLATLYAFEYMEHEGGENTFFGFYMLSYGVTLGIAFAEDLMTLYVFYELLTLATLFLVMHGMKPHGVHAGRKYVYYMLGGAAMGFMALTTVIHFSGTSNFVRGGIPAIAMAPDTLILVMFVMGFLGFGAKAAVFPLHSWLPTAGVAPTPVTALLHAVAVVKAGVFAVIRMAYYCFGADEVRGSWAQAVCLILAMVSILYGSAMSVRETHMKRRLAYSTMSNLSYVLLGAMLLTPEGLTGGLLHMVYHALMKITLFSCVGAVMVRTGRKYVDDLRGMGKKMPFIMGVYLFAALALTGIPPLVGFQSKWALAEAALGFGGWLGIAAVAVLLISAVLTAIYMLVPAVAAYAMPLEGDAGKGDPGWRMKLPLAVTCAAMFILIFASKPLVAYIAKVAAGLL